MEDPVQQEAFQAKYIPRQTAPRPDVEGDMKLSVTSYPPLGQVTTVNNSAVIFIVLLETDQSRAAESWEVSVWHSTGEQWLESPLMPIEKAALRPSILKAPCSGNTPPAHSLYFRGSLQLHLPTTFTLKFRTGQDQPWKWTKDQQGTNDGVIIPKSCIMRSETEELSDLIGELNPVFQVSQVRSDTPETTVWSVSTTVKSADGEKSSIEDIKFGKPWSGKIMRWFALIRIWTPWLAPRQGKTRLELDKEAVMCSFMEPGGRHLVLLAISGINNVMTLFKTDGDGNLALEVRSDSEKLEKASVIAAVGNDFESANAAAMYYARVAVRDNETISDEQQKAIKAAEDGADPQWMENWFDGLTYCTWNGLGQQLTEDKVIEAVDILAANNINITNLIIDDNWQSLDYRGHGQFQHGWIEFEADRKTFPSGLKRTVSKIRDKHHHVQHIAVWHALLGYWGGLAPDGKIAQTYKTEEVVRIDGERRNLPLGGKMTVVAKEDVVRYYDEFYRFLSACGIDAVKTDAQFMLDTLKSARDRRDLFTNYLDAWNIASIKHFSIKAISCMSQTPQILFHSQLPQNKPAILVRNSDDFFPEVPSSHPWHIFTNAHNALFTQHLNLLPDWDMFQTVHDYSGFHAAARCVSGGPIYITDVPGKHDIGLIEQMTGQTTRGKTVIFRPNVGKSLDAYVGYDDEVLLKVGTYYGPAITGTSIIGLFNISQRPLTELLPLSRFPCVVEAQLYVVRSHISGMITEPMQIYDPSGNSLITTVLKTRGYDILSAYPLRGFVRQQETIWIATLGLLGKMAGAAAVVSNKMIMVEGGKIVLETSLKALGVLGIYISALSTRPASSFLLITILGKVVPEHTISVSKSSPHVLEIDIATAWKEMDLDSGWSNEVAVTVFINAT